ncbi:N-6 DNA methylase [Vibrio metschnikovii]
MRVSSTPSQAVTRFIVNRLDPKLGEQIMDPACGTGGFLACSFDHVKENYVTSAADHQILQKQIHGVEKKQLPHLLCINQYDAPRHRSPCAD